jgi:hypothetical protein
MDLTERRIRLLGVVGLLLLVLGTPVATIFAIDYRMVETANPPPSAPVVSYADLTEEQRAAVDRAVADDGPWYRTRADAPFNRLPIVVQKDAEPFDQTHVITLMDQFHWGAWYGKIPLVVFLVSIVCIAVTIRERIRKRGALPRRV